MKDIDNIVRPLWGAMGMILCIVFENLVILNDLKFSNTLTHNPLWLDWCVNCHFVYYMLLQVVCTKFTCNGASGYVARCIVL